MKDLKELKKDFKEVEDYAKEKLGSRAEEFLSTVKVAGVDKTEKGNVIEGEINSSWKRLIDEWTGNYEGKNQMALSWNLSYKKSESDFVTYYGDYSNNPGYVSKIYYGDKEIELKKDNKFSNLFPTEIERNERTTYLPFLNKQYVQNIYHRLFNSLLFDVEVHDKENKVKNTQQLIGRVDKRMESFHRMLGDTVQRIMSAVVRREETKEEIKFLIDDLAIQLRKTPKAPIKNRWKYIEDNNFKVGLARVIALTEKYPFVSLYAPRVLLNEPIYREAINRGLKYETEKKVELGAKETRTPELNWSRLMIQVNVDGEFKKIPYLTYIKNEVNTTSSTRAGEELSAFEDNKEKNKVEEITEDFIKEELEEARKEVAKGLERMIPDSYSGGNNEAEQKTRELHLLGLEEEEEWESLDSKEKAEEKVEREVIEAGTEGGNTEASEDDYPF